jgi:NAD+ synthase
MLKVNPRIETAKIVTFIRSTLKKQGFTKLVLGLSGGVDSATAACLANQAVGVNHLYVLLLPYQNQSTRSAESVVKLLKLPKEHIFKVNLTSLINQLHKILDSIFMIHDSNLLRGNILSRLRMIFLFDAAKRLNALVCGTENRSEHLLGYFTRFGDEASDLEPLIHLYKTQVYQLAKYLGIPKVIINSEPSAGLWPEQTDEKEMGFSYAEADEILHLYFDKGLKPIVLAQFIARQRGLKSANTKVLVDKVLKRVWKNRFKRETPYTI